MQMNIITMQYILWKYSYFNSDTHRLISGVCHHLLPVYQYHQEFVFKQYGKHTWNNTPNSNKTHTFGVIPHRLIRKYNFPISLASDWVSAASHGWLLLSIGDATRRTKDLHRAGSEGSRHWADRDQSPRPAATTDLPGLWDSYHRESLLVPDRGL